MLAVIAAKRAVMKNVAIQKKRSVRRYDTVILNNPNTERKGCMQMGILQPFIFSEDARAQADFYVKSLGGEIVSIITYGDTMGTQSEGKDKVLHMCVSVAGENSIFMADSMEPISQGSGISLNVRYRTESEAREAFEKLAEGGIVKQPIGWQPFGVYLGELTDKYGMMWMINAEPQTKPE